jgi:hypothetical protein
MCSWHAVNFGTDLFIIREIVYHVKFSDNCIIPTAQVSSIKNTAGRWVRNNLEKASTSAQSLEKRFHPYPGLDTLPVLNSNDYLDMIPLVNHREVAEEIRTNLNPQKTSGFDLIVSEILKNCNRKALVNLKTLINACFRLIYITNA